MINGSAVHPGDIVTASNGKTIEINNTDAEGRLTLADALVYACKLEPDVVVDLADRIAFLDRGLVLAEGAPREIMTDPKLAAIYFGDRSHEAAA